MSRSYHVTVAQLKKLQKTNFADKSEKTRRYEFFNDELRDKRTVKSAERLWRRQLGEDLRTVVDTIPVIIDRETEFVRHGIMADDVHGLLKLLPPGTADGLTAVHLCLGAEHQDLDDGDDPDPLSGRLGVEFAAGVYTGGCYGCYYPHSAKIFIFSWVFSADNALAKIMMPYLRLYSLSTLLHELAHHFDQRERLVRSRWSASDIINVERYAEARQHIWTQQYALPYLQTTYSEECQTFLDWIYEWGGVKLEIADFLPEVRTTSRTSDLSLDACFGLNNGLKTLFNDVRDGVSKNECQYEFARWLCTSDRYEAALAQNTFFLTVEPQNISLLLERARIFKLAEHFDESREILDAIIAQAPHETDAWLRLCQLNYIQKMWPQLEVSAKRLLKLVDYATDDWFNALNFCGHVGIYMENSTLLQKTLDSLAEIDNRIANRYLNILKSKSITYEKSKLSDEHS